MTRVPDSDWSLPVEGVNLTGPAFGDQLTEPTLVVFLRHFGCIFCREMVKDLRGAQGDIAGFPQILYVYQGTPADGQAFFDKHHPGARAIADLPRTLYNAFDIQRATMGQGFGPMVWSCAIRAVAKGNGVGKPIGDPWMLPGMFLIHPDQSITWSHPFKHVGDHPDLRTIPTSVDDAVSPAAGVR
jgi:hypothetical protein